VAGINVTDPAAEPFTVTTPVELIDTVTATGLELIVPNCSVTVEVDEPPLACTPAVPIDSEHGLTVTFLPEARGEVAGKVDAATSKIHEPYFITPVAVPSVELILNEGVAAEPKRLSDVVEVVPKDGKPLAKPKLLSSTPCTTAAPVVGLMAADVLVVATSAPGAGVLSPPPHAARNIELDINMAAKEILLKRTKYLLLKIYKYCIKLFNT